VTDSSTPLNFTNIIGEFSIPSLSFFWVETLYVALTTKLRARRVIFFSFLSCWHATHAIVDGLIPHRRRRAFEPFLNDSSWSLRISRQ
jgi:hypothetical protein